MLWTLLYIDLAKPRHTCQIVTSIPSPALPGTARKPKPRATSRHTVFSSVFRIIFINEYSVMNIPATQMYIGVQLPALYPTNDHCCRDITPHTWICPSTCCTSLQEKRMFKVHNTQVHAIGRVSHCLEQASTIHRRFPCRAKFQRMTTAGASPTTHTI